MSIWVCGACGKWWRGERDNGKTDVSCFLHAVECKENERTQGKDSGRETEGWEAI